MRLDVYPAGSGDCVLLTAGKNSSKRTLLADAGMPDAYDEFIAEELSRKVKKIDVAYVSHIDRDHIGGILRLLDHEVQWRVSDHMKKKKIKFRTPEAPRPPAIGEIWHNAFLDDIAKTKAIQLEAALAASANALAGLNAAALGDAGSVDAVATARMLALSVGDAVEVNWRIGKDQLDIPLNPDFGGGFMVARPAQPTPLGPLSITVLGPTATELRELKKEWLTWLDEKAGYIENLKKQHRRDVEDMRSGLSPRDIARLTRELVLKVEKDVTPPNLASLVLLVAEASGNGKVKRVLLTGDAGDQTMLGYFRDANLLDGNGHLVVDVLKVPHHGADNSFSDAFASTVRARDYIFCGDGDNGNPEPDVVAGYIKAVKGAKGKARFWFNWSRERATQFKSHWTKVEKLVDAASGHIERRSIGIGDVKLSITV